MQSPDICLPGLGLAFAFDMDEVAFLDGDDRLLLC
jgi:hypothetical protein